MRNKKAKELRRLAKELVSVDAPVNQLIDHPLQRQHFSEKYVVEFRKQFHFTPTELVTKINVKGSVREIYRNLKRAYLQVMRENDLAMFRDVT